MDDKKIDLLLDNYKIINEEAKSYRAEMIRCFIYASILISVCFGYGAKNDITTIDLPYVKYAPIGLLFIVLYFYTLGYLYMTVSMYKSFIETKMNKQIGSNFFEYESVFKDKIVRPGNLIVKKVPIPSPSIFLALSFAFVIVLMFFYTGLFQIYTIGILISVLLLSVLGLYVFIWAPRIIRNKYEKEFMKEN